MKFDERSRSTRGESWVCRSSFYYTTSLSHHSFSKCSAARAKYIHAAQACPVPPGLIKDHRNHSSVFLGNFLHCSRNRADRICGYFARRTAKLDSFLFMAHSLLMGLHRAQMVVPMRTMSWGFWLSQRQRTGQRLLVCGGCWHTSCRHHQNIGGTFTASHFSKAFASTGLSPGLNLHSH